MYRRYCSLCTLEKSGHLIVGYRLVSKIVVGTLSLATVCNSTHNIKKQCMYGMIVCNFLLSIKREGYSVVYKVILWCVIELQPSCGL